MSEHLLGWPEGQRTIGLAALAKLLNIHVSTAWRWVRHGVTPTTGFGTVKLPAERLGGLWRVSRDGLRRFLAAVNGADPRSLLDDPEEAERCAERLRATLPKRRR